MILRYFLYAYHGARLAIVLPYMLTRIGFVYLKCTWDDFKCAK